MAKRSFITKWKSLIEHIDTKYVLLKYVKSIQHIYSILMELSIGQLLLLVFDEEKISFKTM